MSKTGDIITRNLQDETVKELFLLAVIQDDAGENLALVRSFYPGVPPEFQAMLSKVDYKEIKVGKRFAQALRRIYKYLGVGMFPIQDVYCLFIRRR